MEGELIFNDAVETPHDNLDPKQDTTNEASFNYDGVIVHVKFSEDGEGLDELLINYFKSLN